MAETPPIVLPETGEIINERYRVDGKLGKGGMGQVYCVRDLQTQEDVALKYLSVPKDKPNAIDRFKSEFSKLAQFPHPNISAVYDFGHDDDRDMFFFTSELIVGKSFFDGTRGMGPAKIEGIVVQTLRALEYLHNHRLVHYDIKPGNVLITQDATGAPIAKVIDFGVAEYGFKGRLVGTPSYMAPEMTRREIPDQRADLYSLGVMWYQALAGVPDSPFRGANRDETFYNQQTKQLPPLTALHDDITTTTDRIITRLLSKKPEDRFSFSAAVIAEINLSKANPSERYDIETRETRQSYIPSTARFVGREPQLTIARQFLQDHLTPPVKLPPDLLWITGAKGVGKSRLLAEMRHIAQLNGFEVAGAAADNPATWDTLRAAIANAIDTPTTPTLLWADGIPAELQEDVNRLQDYLVSSRDLGERTSHICFAAAVTTLPENVSARNAIQVPLKPFDAAELTDYLRSVTGFETPPEGFVDELMRHTEGNPYFVTELMRSLIDQNILLDDAGRWKATTFEDLGVDFSAVRVPGSMADALAVDYNQLSSPEQELLALIAVWNGPASPTELERVMGHRMEPTAPMKLLKKGWIDMDISTSAMSIPNPNRRMAIEALQSQSQRVAWHHAIAKILEADGSADPEQIHWHFAHSDNPKRSTESRWILAEHYVATQRPLAAITMLQELIAHAEPKSDIYINAQLLLARTYRTMRRFDEALALLKTMDSATNARVWEEMAITANKLNRFEDAETYCMKGLQVVAQHHEESALKIRLENYLGQTFLMRGFLDRAIDTFRRTRQEAETLTMDERRQIVNNDLCYALFQKGSFAEMITEGEKDLIFYNDIGNVRQYLRINLLMANAYRNLRQTGKASAHMEKGVEIARAKHDSEYLFFNYQDLGNLYSETGKPDEAAQHYERALDLARRLGDPTASIAVKTNLGILHARMGNLDAAESDFLSLIDYMKLHPPTAELSQMYACRAHLELGDMYVKQSRFDEAKVQLDGAEHLVRKHANCGPLLFSVQLTRAELHRDMGDKQGAKKLIATLRKHARSPEEIHQLDITETTIEETEH